MAQKYTGIGLMSGTSMDGLDIVCCEFILKEKSKIDYRFIHTETFDFPANLKERLTTGMEASGSELTRLDVDFGEWAGKICNNFIQKNKVQADFIASHGHTIFHEPNKKITLQVGDGNQIHALTGIPVVYDFRSLDVALGGQGAPLVPIGDELLFPEHNACLNLGGFANVSFTEKGHRKAFDIGGVNTILNALAHKLGHPYDDKGALARAGKYIPDLDARLGRLSYYNDPIPKSLGIEWIQSNVIPLLAQYAESRAEDVLNTYTIHIARVISNDLNRIASFSEFGHQSILVTGGGAYNEFLIGQIQGSLAPGVKLVIPDAQLIDYKEALIFALMGILRLQGAINCFKSVTGAERDSCTGIVVGTLNK